MYIKRGNVKIKRIISDLRDAIADSKKAGFVRVLYTNLHVRAVMSVMLAKQPGIFPHACVSI